MQYRFQACFGKALVTALCLFVGLFAGLFASLVQASSAGTWKAELAKNGNRYLTWSASVPMLGKPTKVDLAFQCNPKSVKDVHGTIGFDLYLTGVAALKPFAFDKFEGPDATAGQDGRQAMVLTVTRKGKAPLVIKLTPNGGIPDDGKFAFSMADMSKLAKSDSRTLLNALASDDAESFQVSITDPTNAKLKLEVTVPVAGKQADFRTLMTGLK